jgi:hypothetical protein
LLHCGISIPAMSVEGLGRVKTLAAAARVECLEEIVRHESQIMLRMHRSNPRWRIVFSTFWRCI